MNILILGNGGREHALAWKAAQSPLAETVFVAPGNGGTAQEANIKNVDISATDIPALITFAKENNVGLTIVGPEAPLVIGVVDAFQEAGLKIFGPSKGAAQLEGSKAFSKDFFKKYNIPTAAYGVFTDTQEAIAFLDSQSYPIVIKADGLAAGKGVIIAQDREEAVATIQNMLEGNQFGNAGSRVVIEEFLEGEEASYIAMLDGKTIRAFASSQDHKAALDGDKGPNTGGMGAYSPAPVVTPELEARILKEVMQPTLDGMEKEGFPYTGFLYAGVMVDANGVPKVLEFNCRFGDPETQPIMMRLESDLVAACLAATEQKLDEVELKFCNQAAVGVVMAAGGYPDAYEKGKVISGIPAEGTDTLKVFQAGTELKDGQILTNGGRVLCVTALADTVTAAQAKAYSLVKDITWENVYYRTDIAHRAIKREQ
ncbi:MAG: phosphoribosylamine--glycine ligase [Pseudomonadota bacterium]|nr:phosphoribosylamine--glycine ligase [Pseudomonadota bacterium]HBF09249.1 phosphoribosylamine--glycine ligase [Gammaproteobacteria bacterium]|tara:strand:+ start:91586 stop:92869 length:1284 start_codon:yes stop_codon:yes gene_type:complete